MKSLPFSLVKIPDHIQFTLYLIKEELKSRKLFRVLDKIASVNCYLQPHLDSLILNSLGLHDWTDETFTRYDAILEKRSKKIQANPESIMKQAFKVYMELLEMKRTVNS